MKNSTRAKKFRELGKQAFLAGLKCEPEHDENFKKNLPKKMENASLFLEMYFAWQEGWHSAPLEKALIEWGEERRKEATK